MRESSMKTKLLSAILLPALLLLFGVAVAVAGEHPEHPEKKTEKEHPEQPEHPQDAAKIDVEMMAAAITGYVETDTKLKGGFFLVFDAASSQPLQLTLAKVHKERLAQVGDNLYFACSDFNEKSGKLFDLDFFMMAEDGKLEVTEVMIHKEDGKPRYSWFEDEGIWKRK